MTQDNTLREVINEIISALGIVRRIAEDLDAQVKDLEDRVSALENNVYYGEQL